MRERLEYFTLNTGAKIPSVGLGTWKSSPGEVGETVIAAVKAGYRHIDCAALYGNEKEVGSTLQELFHGGVLKREDLFITSKLWCTHHAPEDVPEAMDSTLRDLQLDYVDLYLIHWPCRLRKGGAFPINPDDFLPPNIPATWAAMEALCFSGKARAIGVSNFSTKKLADLLAVARLVPAVNQVECHPAWQQRKLRDFCRSHGIHLSGYGPLGAPGTKWMMGTVLDNKIVKEVASKLGRSPAQVALRWGIQMGHSVLPKSVRENRVKENLDLFSWSIPNDWMALFDGIPQRKFTDGNAMVHENNVYTTLEELWDGEI